MICASEAPSGSSAKQRSIWTAPDSLRFTPHIGCIRMQGVPRQALLAVALFTHPIGVLAESAICVLCARFDYRRLRWRQLSFAAIPFIVGFGLWGLYISRDPEAFRTQFGRNASGREGGLRAPLQAIGSEVRSRFVNSMYLP